MHYYCISEAVGNYLQKYIQYRKRKVFAAENNRFEDLLPAMHRRPHEKYLMVMSDVHNEQTLNMFAENNIVVFAPSMAKAMTNLTLNKFDLVYNANVPALAHQVIDGTISPENLSHLQSIAATMPGAAGMDMAAFAPYYIEKLSTAYNGGFAVACVALIISVLIYYSCRSWFKHADVNAKQAKAANPAAEVELTPAQTKSRIGALIFVFAVVIFFWMAFHQNGATMTFFARDYTASSTSGILRIGFNIWCLALIALSVYTLFNVGRN